MTVRPDDVVQVADGDSLPQVGVVLTGHALVTGPARGPPRPPRLPGFSSDPRQSVTALDPLARLDPLFDLPGHGPPHRGPVRDAVRRARDR